METEVRSPNSREDLLRLFQVLPPGWDAECPSILSIIYYPLQIVISEWTLYVLLMSRYVKYYEYSFKTVGSRLEHFAKSDIIELHRWRRRSQQSIQKLRTTRQFIENWCSRIDPSRNVISEPHDTPYPVSEAPALWSALLMDVQQLEWQIIQNSRSLESLSPIITSMVQLIASHDSIAQAKDVRRLTYIAIAFIPLSYLASIFSMSDPFGPAGEMFWVYWAAAVPLAIAILAFSIVTGQMTALLDLLGSARRR